METAWTPEPKKGARPPRRMALDGEGLDTGTPMDRREVKAIDVKKAALR